MNSISGSITQIAQYPVREESKLPGLSFIYRNQPDISFATVYGIPYICQNIFSIRGPVERYSDLSFQVKYLPAFTTYYIEDVYKSTGGEGDMLTIGRPAGVTIMCGITEGYLM
jgi:hypothetical protein